MFSSKLIKVSKTLVEPRNRAMGLQLQSYQ